MIGAQSTLQRLHSLLNSRSFRGPVKLYIILIAGILFGCIENQATPLAPSEPSKSSTAQSSTGSIEKLMEDEDSVRVIGRRPEPELYTEQMPYPLAHPPFTFTVNIDYSVASKQTRRIQTPKGIKEIYDPAFDPELIDRFQIEKAIKRYVVQQARIPQVRQLSRLGCRKFTGSCGGFYYGDLGTGVCAEYKANGYSSEEECQIAITGTLHWGDGCQLCRPKSSQSSLPLQAICFAERVRLDCAEWDDE